MSAEAAIQCPWCGETLDLWVERDTEGEMIQDCDICCRPLLIRVSWPEDTVPGVVVERA